MTIAISREYSSPRAPGAAFAIILTLAVNGVLFGAIGWINSRAVKVADQRIRSFTPVTVVRPPPVVQPQIKPAKPKLLQPEAAKPLTVKREPLRTPRTQHAPTPRPLSLKLDLPSFEPTLTAGLALPISGVNTPSTVETANLLDQSGPLGYDDVETKPSRTRYVRPVFPSLARRLGQSGDVTVEFVIDETGAVTEPTVVESTGNGRFDRSALRAVSGWEFTAAQHHGQAVPVRCRVTVEFKLDGN